VNPLIPLYEIVLGRPLTATEVANIRAGIGPRRKQTKRAFVGLAGSPLSGNYVEPPPPPELAPPEQAPPEPILPVEKKKTGRPPRHGAAMSAAERKRESRARKDRDEEIKKLIAEQKIDDETGGLHGPGLVLVADRLTGRGPSPRQAQITSGGYGRTKIEQVSLKAEAQRIDLLTFGGRRRGSSVSVDEGFDEPPGFEGRETEEQFQRRQHHPRNWVYDRRDKQEIARKVAADFIEVFDPKRYLKWDQSSREFIPWDAVMCLVCQRVFSFTAYAVDHIVDIIGDALLRNPTSSSPLESRAEVLYNLDITRHRRAVLKGIGELQPKRTK
jgi:hypothetical protein